MNTALVLAPPRPWNTSKLLPAKAPTMDFGKMWDDYCDDMIDPPREAKCKACGSPYVDTHGYKCPNDT